MQGLFIGMATLDTVYFSTSVPSSNQKISASDFTMAAGGPAANAAATFSYLGNRALLLAVIGKHPIAQLLRSDLAERGVEIRDLDPQQSQPPPLSSIIVTQSTGDRAVISMNAAKIQVSEDKVSPEVLAGVDLVLIDGHQMAASIAIAKFATSKGIPVVIDGGSWKPGYDRVLPFVDYAICSANFYPPNCPTFEDVLTYLADVGIANIGITKGGKPIQVLSQGRRTQIEVPKIDPVDTLGAGDIFHGAFCHYILRQNFLDALTSASQVAARSCQFFGTRQWMSEGIGG